MFKSKIYPNRYVLLLSLLVLFHLVLNLVWQKINTAPPSWDSAGHLTLSYVIADKITNFFKGEAGIVDLLKSSTYYPPLVQSLGGIVSLIFGRNYEYALLVETFFFLLAIIYLYAIVRHFFPDKPELAIVTAFIFSFFPQVWEQSRQFHLDIPLCAMVLAGFYHLSRSKSLTDIKHSVLFFLFFSLTQLTKWYGFVFFVAPFVYEVLIKTFRAHDWRNKLRVVGMGYGAIVVLILAVPWYFVNIKSILANFAISSTADFGDPQIVLSYESVFHYLKLMTSHQVGAFSVLLFFISLYVIFRDKLPFRRYVFWVFALPYVVFTIIQNKDLRYVLPLTPVVAFLISYLVTQFGNKTWIKVKTALFCVYLFSLYLFFSFNQTNPLPPSLKIFAVGIGGPYMQSWVNEANGYSYNPSNYRVNDIVNKVQETADKLGISANHFKVLTLSDNKFYSVADFDMFTLQNKYYNMSIITPFYQLGPFAPNELNDYLASINLALIPQSPGPSGLRNIEALNQLITYFTSDQNSDFTAVESYDIPDGNKLTLYKRVNLDTYVNPEVLENSIKVNASTILLLDKEKFGGGVVKVTIYKPSGGEEIKEFSARSGQQRMSLAGIDKFKIDLPKNQIDTRELRGWFYLDGGVFERDPKYFENVALSGNELMYENMTIQPKNKVYPFGISPKVTVALEDNKIKLILMNPGEKVFVAYATSGWNWNNFWLDGSNKETELPVEGLLQVEVTQKSQLIRGFDTGWDFFTCYKGNAVCFYPVVKELE